MTEARQFALLTERRFAPFFLTQFLGACNDNVFRNGLIIVVTFRAVDVFGLNASELANIGGVLFILPFFLFSATSGQLADKFEKAVLMRRIKLIEVALMSFAAIALLAQQYTALFAILFLMGCQSTLFGPVKYAYMPQHLERNELIGGNALVESGTYLAIILGLIIGSVAVSIDPQSHVVLATILVLVAVAGLASAYRVPATPAPDPGIQINRNIWKETWNIVGYARQERSVFISIIAISWFWFFATVMTLQTPAYALQILQGNEVVTTVLLVAFAVGIGIGSLLCERLSGRRIEPGLVPVGALGLGIFSIDLLFAQPEPLAATVSNLDELLVRPGNLRILFDLTMLGAFGGLFSVPLYAMVQERANARQLSRIIAANNIINSLFMIAAAAFALLLLAVGLSIPELFAALGAANLIFAVYLCRANPEFVDRTRQWLLLRKTE